MVGVSEENWETVELRNTTIFLLLYIIEIVHFLSLFCLSFGYSVKKILCRGKRFPSRVSKGFFQFCTIAWKGGVCCLSGSTHSLGIPISTHANFGVIRQSKMLAAKKEEKEFRRPKIRLPQLGGRRYGKWVVVSSWADAFVVRSRHLRTEREEEVECAIRHFCTCK